MNKLLKIILFAVLSFVMGSIAGAVIWIVLKIMSVGIETIWVYIPDALEIKHMLLYNVIICVTGGAIIGMWQRKYGLLPDDMEGVIHKIKTEGSYPYKNIHIIAISALLPLVFGGTLGPEAGLSGIIAGLCCFIGDKLKYKADEVAALAEGGIAATLCVIFNAPFFGIADNIEGKIYNGGSRKRLVSKRTRIIIYACGAAGGFLSLQGLSALFGGGLGIPRFDMYHDYGFDQWKWFILFLAIGIILALFYLTTQKITSIISKKIEKYRILSCIIAGIILALIGYFLPLTMFSGEENMEQLMSGWSEYSFQVLLMTALCKLMLVNVCINFGWRGGSIFPIIFAGLSAGYAFNSIVLIDGSFAVAVTIAALYSYITHKPVTVIAVLFLCFPITYVLPIAAAAFIAGKIPMIKF